MKLPSLLIFLIILGSCTHAPKPNQKKTGKEKSPEFNLAYTLYHNQDEDSAFIHFNKLIEMSKDRFEIAMAHTFVGIIQNNKGFYYDSQESFIKSLQFLDERDSADYQLISDNYNELGLSELNLKKSDEALINFNNALFFSNDTSKTLEIINNKALALTEKQQYDDAIKLYDSVLLLTKHDLGMYARVLSNLARTKWLKDTNYNAAPEMHAALQIRIQTNNVWGLNASYGRLSDYYLTSSPDSALFYANKMYKVAQELGSPDDMVFALQKLIMLGPADSIRKNFALYQHLNDSIQNAQKTAANRFAVIIYETEKQKANNFELQKENAETKLRVIWQRVFSVVLTVLAIMGFIWYRKRKQQAMRQQELRTSQKVHDVVANGLYTIINKIEHEQELEKEQLLDEMEVLYEQSRNISYNRDETTHKYSEDLIPGLLKSFSTPETRVLIVGYSPALWSRINSLARNETRYALQNLMINMKKHSRAKNVAVRFEQVNDQLKIQYSDDGIGVSPNFRYGNGLKSTETRINRMGGQLIFDLSAPQGVKIKILIPIEQAL